MKKRHNIIEKDAKLRLELYYFDERVNNCHKRAVEEQSAGNSNDKHGVIFDFG